MSKLSEQIAELESAHIALQAERDALERQVRRQEGAIKEGRRQLDRAHATIKEQREMIATYKAHFHTFHGSAERVAEEEKVIASVEAPTVVEMPSLRERLARMVKRDEEVAA